MPKSSNPVGKAGWRKYDEMTVAGVEMHFYRKPKRFRSCRIKETSPNPRR